MKIEERSMGRILVSESDRAEHIKGIKETGKGNRMAGIVTEILNYSAFPILLVTVWQILSKTGFFSPILMPSLEVISKTFMMGVQSGQIAADLAVSLVRVVKGYGWGIGLGISFGILMGISLRTSKFFSLMFTAIRQIPPLAWVPLVILWFGIGETSKVILIAKSSFFPILLNTIEGIHCLSPGYLELAKLYKINKKDLVLKIYIPSALPFIFTGLRLGAGAAWLTVVAAEIIVSTSGIGYRINDARNLMQSDIVMVNMTVIGIVGVLMDALLKYAEKILPFEKYRRV
jgi:sulfonate transport system permease protein